MFIKNTLCASFKEDAKLYVVTPITNTQRYKNRYKLYKNFEKMVNDSGAILYTIEAAYGNRPFEVTTEENTRNIQLRTNDELWQKENLINIAIQRLPSDWEYVAWIDGDISFARSDWVSETIHQLQHYNFVQMFSNAVDLSPDFKIIRNHNGFVYSYKNKMVKKNEYSNWHPGFAWATTKNSFNSVGGLIEHAVVGSADKYMALGLIGKINESLNEKLNKNYINKMKKWESLAEENIKRNIGFVDGTILHYWHGDKKNRGYDWRSKILIENNFDPDVDLKKDWQGMFSLVGNKIKLRDDIIKYFKSRDEDGNQIVKP